MAATPVSVAGGTVSSVGPEGVAPAVPGEVLLRFRPSADRSDQAVIRRTSGVRLKRRLSLPRLELVETTADRTVAEVVAGLEARPEVAYAEPNFLFHVDAQIPDDPRFGEQWGLDVIDAPEAWETTTGSTEVVVAVLDTGLEYEHPDLAANVWVNPGETGGGLEANGLDDDNNGLIDDHSGYDFVGDENDPRDANGHGTHVSGILGAEGDNATGVAGVNWDTAIMPLRVCEAGGACELASVVEAIEYAGDKGADVANMSFSGGSFSQAQKDAIDAAGGTLFVASAGNSGMNNESVPQFPCSHTSSNLVCVAASTQTDTRWDPAGPQATNFGAASVDLAAPGDGVLATLPPFDPIFSDDFEGAANWDFVEAPSTDAAKWERTTEPGEDALSPVKSASDSAGSSYASGSTATMVLTSPVDLATRVGCSLHYWTRLQTQAGADFLRVDAAHDADPFIELDQWSGTTPGGGYALLSSDLGGFDGEGQTGIRFRLTANNDTSVGDGAHLDDVSVRCLKPVASYGVGEGYGELSGTSMAAPHVAGVAALLKAATTGATVAQLREALLISAEPAPAFAGMTVTGGRLDAAAAMTFITDATPPSPFDLLAPAQGATVTSASPTFSWQASTDPESGATYRLFVDGVMNLETQGLFATPTAPLDEGPHTWHVEAVNGMGLVTQSTSTRTLTIDVPSTPITHGRTVSLRLRKHLVARGMVAVPDGFAACREDVLVELHRKRGGQWLTIRVVAANDGGSYRSPLADRTGRYRARVAQSQSGNDACGEDVSAAVRHRH